MELKEIVEGRARILVPDVPRLKGPGKKHSGFYNPLMAFNRDVSVLVLAALAKSGEVRRPLDGMAGTGIRGVRWALEVPGVEVGINEPSRLGAELVKRNVELNSAKACVYATGVASATMEHRADYADIDPFGSPVPYYFPVIQNIRKGFVSVTATDTAALAGSVRRTARRRYHVDLVRTPITHEVGLRALMGALVRDAARVDREITPLLCYFADHYYRAYFRVRRNSEGADRALSQVREVVWQGRVRISRLAGEAKRTLTAGDSPIEYHADSGEDAPFGPLWCGPLTDRPVVQAVMERLKDPEACPTRERAARVLATLAAEEEVGGIGFHRVDYLAQRTRTEPMSPEALVKALRASGAKASRTHFDPGGVRTDAGLEEVLEVVRSKATGSARKAR